MRNKHLVTDDRQRLYWDVVWHTKMILLLFIGIMMGCSVDNYTALPVEIYESGNLPIDKIIPSESYDYWEYRFSDIGKEEVIYKRGEQQLDSISIENQTNGFFVECDPLLCYSYIVAVKDGGLFIIDTPDKFRNFVGNVDNVQEVVILIKLSGYWFDPSDSRTGSYKKTADGYELFVLDYESCPVTFKSVKALLRYNGDFEVIKVETIKEESDCILS